MRGVCNVEFNTYRSVDRLIAFHVSILVDSVVSLAESDTGYTASDEAEINRIETVE
jgi:hypothetical protein